MASNELAITKYERIMEHAAQNKPFEKPVVVLIIEPDQPDQKPVWISNINRGRPKNPEIIVRKRSNAGARQHPFVGFKVLFRCNVDKRNPVTHSYTDVSIVIDPRSCTMSHRVVDAADKPKLINLAPGGELGRVFVDQVLHQIDFVPSTRQAFITTSSTIPLRTSNQYVKNAYNTLDSINKASKVILLMQEDRAFVSHVDRILEIDQKSQASQSALAFIQPPLPRGMSNRQMQNLPQPLPDRFEISTRRSLKRKASTHDKFSSGLRKQLAIQPGCLPKQSEAGASSFQKPFPDTTLELALRTTNDEAQVAETNPFLASLDPRTRPPSTGPAPRSHVDAFRFHSRSPSIELAAISAIVVAADAPSATVTEPQPAILVESADLPHVVATHMTRYRAIRQFFAAIHGPHETSPAETHLLLKLGKALLDGDDALFERHYNQLLRSALI